MRLFTIVAEDYFYFMESFFKAIIEKEPQSQIHAYGIRRKTINKKVADSPVRLKSYAWLNDKEKEWLKGPYRPERVEHYRTLLGDSALRDLIICDREFGWGFLSGGLYAQTPLRKMLQKQPDLKWIYICNMLDDYFKNLKDLEISHVFMSEITHIWELGLYHVARALKIPCTVPFYSRFGDVFVMTDNPYNVFTSVSHLFTTSLEQPDAIQPEARQKAREYMQAFRAKPSLVEYSEFFKKQTLRQARLGQWLKTLAKDLTRLALIVSGRMGTKDYLRQRSGWDILKENYQAFRFSRKAIKGDYFSSYQASSGRPFFYFPLHYEPEASTMVFAPKFANQLTLIEQVARSMPAGYQLLVKEHIPNVGRRPVTFYEKLRSIPDVKLISPFENNFQIIKEAALTITITGTAGWEAILLGRPTMIFGQTQYNILGEGFYACDNLGDMTRDLLQAMKTPPGSDSKIEALVAATLQEGVSLPLSFFAYAHYGKDGKSFFSGYDMRALIEKVFSYE